MRPTSVTHDDDDGESGFALIAVLWFLVLVSAVVASFAVAARTDLLIASNARQKLRLDLMAENMATTVSLRLSAAEENSAGDIHLDSAPHFCSSDRYSVELRMQDQAGLIDLNVADEQLLTKGLHSLGLAEDDGSAVAKAIIASRSYQPSQNGQADAPIVGGTKGGPFESVVELSDIEPLSDFEPTDLHRIFTVHSRQPFVLLAHSPEALAQSLEGHAVSVERQRDMSVARALAIEVTVKDRSAAIRGYSGNLIELSESAGTPFRRVEPLFESAFSAPYPEQPGDCPRILGDALTQLAGNPA